MPSVGKEARGFVAGDRVGPYEVLGRIGAGGMASVHLVRRTGFGGLDKRLALKAVLPHLAERPGVVRMFLDEIRMASQVQSPHVVQVIDAGETDGAPWMAMELLRGKTLAEIIERGRLPTREATCILHQAASGLYAAHETRGVDGSPLHIVHRDVSPQNVHVGYDGVAKLVDFGIAKAVGRVTQTASGEMKGKLAYAAPELFEGHRGDVRSDLFAFGVLAWEALVGERLFAGESDAETVWKILNEEIEPIYRRNPDVSREASAVLTRCLEREPERRPASAEEIMLCLERAAAELGGNPRRVGELVTARFAEERSAEARLLEGPAHVEPEPETAPRPPAEPVPVSAAPPSPSAPPAPPARKSQLPMVAGLVLGLGGFGVAIGLLIGRSANPSANPSVPANVPVATEVTLGANELPAEPTQPARIADPEPPEAPRVDTAEPSEPVAEPTPDPEVDLASEAPVPSEPPRRRRRRTAPRPAAAETPDAPAPGPLDLPERLR